MATVTASYNWVSGETVTPAKLNTAAAPTVVVADNEVTTAKILDANVTTAKIADDAVTNDKLSLAANAGEIKKALNADNAPPIFACRAWVNFDGTTTPPTIRASGNVASVTRNSTGNYTITFTTAMQDASYSATVSSNSDFGAVTSLASGSFVIATSDGAFQPINASLISVAIFR
jgi:stringent starvation protein B